VLNSIKLKHASLKLLITLNVIMISNANPIIVEDIKVHILSKKSSNYYRKNAKCLIHYR